MVQEKNRSCVTWRDALTFERRNEVMFVQKNKNVRAEGRPAVCVVVAPGSTPTTRLSPVLGSDWLLQQAGDVETEGQIGLMTSLSAAARNQMRNRLEQGAEPALSQRGRNCTRDSHEDSQTPPEWSPRIRDPGPITQAVKIATGTSSTEDLTSHS
ncbi:hypothetical protein AAFF_G00265860 [Aldrovandia affinis]|uniref:Uncharacterized protein n=1 Tax=Aldrovandia affinis TaxID=143900 RepID=A0AAD7RBM6_9TELE|nr:hypothetical protein AAFF_G00265860 [Aldrovandia affinis]